MTHSELLEKVKPSGHRLLVEIDKTADMVGQIHLTRQTQEANQRQMITGTVVSIGSECWKDTPSGEPWCKVGDKVIIAKYGGLMLHEMKLVMDPETGRPANDYDFRILNDEDIVAVMS